MNQSGFWRMIEEVRTESGGEIARAHQVLGVLASPGDRAMAQSW